MAEDDSTRITVSRDALRADLAEMELRLRIYFDGQLYHKADAVTMADVAFRVEKQERGDFTDAQRVVIDKQIREARTVETTLSWTVRSRLMGVVSLITAVAMVTLSFIALRGGSF